MEKPLKLVLKVGGSEVTELSGSGHDSSYYDDRSDHERERHKEKKKKKKKKSEKEKEKHLDDEERRKRKVSWHTSLHSCLSGVKSDAGLCLNQCWKKLIVWRNMENPCVWVGVLLPFKGDTFCDDSTNKVKASLLQLFIFLIYLPWMNASVFQLDVLYFSQGTTIWGRVFSSFQINPGSVYLFEVYQVTGHWNWYFYSEQFLNSWVLWYITWLALGKTCVPGFVALLVASSVVTLVVSEYWGVWLKSAVRYWWHSYLYNLILMLFSLCRNGSWTFLFF